MATPTSLPASFTVGQTLTADTMNNLRGAFRVLTVNSVTKTDTFSTTSTTFTDVTGLSLTITPQSNTSKFLLVAQISAGANGPDRIWFKFAGGNTASDVGVAIGCSYSRRILTEADCDVVQCGCVKDEQVEDIDLSEAQSNIVTGWGEDMLDAFDDDVLGDARWAANCERLGGRQHRTHIEGGDQFGLGIGERVDDEGHFIESDFRVLVGGEEG